MLNRIVSVFFAAVVFGMASGTAALDVEGEKTLPADRTFPLILTEQNK